MQECPWPPLHSEHGQCLGALLIVFGTVGAAVNGWLISTVLLSCVLNARPYLLVLNVAVACLGRAVLAGFPFSGTSALAGIWLFGSRCCQMFAFLRLLFGLAQLFSLLLSAVERAVVVRYPDLGDRVSSRGYLLAMLTVWGISSAWAAAPLAGWGSYNCDATGTACDVDWRPNPGSNLGYNLSLFIVGGIIPAVGTVLCVWKAAHSDDTPHVSMTQGLSHEEHHALAKAMAVVCAGMLLVWSPYGIQLCWVLGGNSHVPMALSVMASLGTEASTMLPALVFLVCPTGVRPALLGTLVRGGHRRSVRLSDIK